MSGAVLRALFDVATWLAGYPACCALIFGLGTLTTLRPDPLVQLGLAIAPFGIFLIAKAIRRPRP